MSNFKNTAVIGDGAWGTALACVLCENRHNVTLWGAFPDYLEKMRQERVNSRFLPDIQLPEALRFEADIAKVAQSADFLIMATPTQFMRPVLQKLKPYFDPERHVLVNVAKGIEVKTHMRISQLCGDILGACRYCVLAGPSHAEEVARRVPTAVVVASVRSSDAEAVQQLFINDYFRVYTAEDPIGVELGGALKNVIAVAAGVIDGMQLGDNPKAALITRGITEMGRLGNALGGSAETFAGLSGVGDLIVTCTSGHSRNRHVGEELGRGKKIEQINAEMGMVVAEGVKTAESAYELAGSCNIETPIIEQVYKVIYENKSPQQAVKELMTRKARPEQD